MTRNRGDGVRVAAVWGATALAAAAVCTVAARGAPADETRLGDPRVELGRRLFFDPAVSRSGDNSCVSCHLPDHGFSSPARFDVDDFSRARRHSQTLIDAALSPSFHWDGEFDSIEELVTARLLPVMPASGGRPRSTGGVGSGGGGGYGGGGSSSASGKIGTPTEAPPPVPTNEAPDPAPPDDDPVTTPAEGDPADGTGAAPKPAGYAPAGPGGKAVGRSRDAAREDRQRVLVRMRTPNDPDTKLDHPTVAERVEADGRYDEGFAQAFGTPQVTTARIAEAISVYVRSLRSGTSPYDRFAAGEERALSDSAKRGLELFRGRAGCVQCHAMSGARPAFTDHAFHNTGVAARARVRHVSTGPCVGGDCPTTESVLLPRDLGRGRLTSKPDEDASFKTPTLRDVARRAPYMHDGSLDTLARVVRRYAAGGTPDSNLDPRIRRFECGEQDVSDLTAFLEALTSDVPVGIAPSPRGRAERTTVRLVDGRGRPLAGVTVSLTPDGDRLPGDRSGAAVSSASRTETTDADGRIEFAPGRRTHTRLGLPDGLEAPQGGMVPDTCRSLTLALPVAGRTGLAVVLPAGAVVPMRLPVDCDRCALDDAAVALLSEHAPRVLAHARERVTTFTHVSTIPLAGVTIARYEAWVPAADEKSAAGAAAAPRTHVTVAHPTGPRRVAVRLEAGEETRADLTR
jgi:cytochrome c peroxidase